MTAEHWDTICIGAGITSLAFGALAAKYAPDRRILILDRHSVPGGYASVFPRPKAQAVFECSLHKVSGANKNSGNLHRLFVELGLDSEIGMTPCSVFFEVEVNGDWLVLPCEPQAFQQALLSKFPAEATGLKRFFDELFSFGRDSYYMRQILDGTHAADLAGLRWAHRNLTKISAMEALDERIGDPQLKEILGLPTVYVGGFAEDLSYLYYLHILYATLCAGTAFVNGGAQRLSNALAQRIEAVGGMVKLRTPAIDILPGIDGEHHKVITNRGEFSTPNLYINTSPTEAFDQLLRTVPGLEQVREKVASLTPSWSTTTLYLTTDRDPAELGLTVAETMILPSKERRHTHRRRSLDAAGGDPLLCEELLWRGSHLEVTNYHLLNPSAGRIICVNTFDLLKNWPERRDPTYQVRKRKATEILLQRLLTAKPKLRGHVIFTELATPRTYHRFTRNTDGAGYGAIVSGAASGHNFHHNFPYRGIHFLSGWVAGAGYEAAFTYAESKLAGWLPTRDVLTPRVAALSA